MAKKTEPVAEHANRKPALRELNVVLNRDELSCGDRVLTRGERLATVILAPDVSLNFLARAIEDSFAGPSD